jgi:ankyrin repeat protein
MELRNYLLFDACCNGLLDVVKDLVERGADVNVKKHYGLTALHAAFLNYNLDVAEYLVNHGADTSVLRQVVDMNPTQRTSLKRMFPHCSLWNDTIEGYSKGYQKCACYFHTESILNLVIASNK